MAATAWQKAFGYTDEAGNTNQGSFGTIANTGINAFGAFNSWQSLEEAKKNNKHTREFNRVNSRNAARDFNERLQDQTETRMATRGQSQGSIDRYLESKEYGDRRATSL